MNRFGRRDFVKSLAGICVAGTSCSKKYSHNQNTIRKKYRTGRETSLQWYDVREWGIEGKGWTDTEDYFDRLPAPAKKRVDIHVWGHAKESAGMMTRFETDATDIWTRWKVAKPNLELATMPATSVSGLDLYTVDQNENVRWAGVAAPTKKQTTEKILRNAESGKRKYMLYLPLYNQLESLKIGVPNGSYFTGLPPRKQKPVVFYGTSIVQGGCASRPGMNHSAIIARRLSRPLINLGFAGHGKMQPEVVKLLAQLDPCIYVIDCLPNMTGKMVAEATPDLVKILRKKHTRTPIVLVEDRTYANAHIITSGNQRNLTNRAALRKAYENLKIKGIKNLHYVTGDDLLGHDTLATVDGSHPTDLGFMRMADKLEPILKTLI